MVASCQDKRMSHIPFGRVSAWGLFLLGEQPGRWIPTAEPAVPDAWAAEIRSRLANPYDREGFHRLLGFDL